MKTEPLEFVLICRCRRNTDGRFDVIKEVELGGLLRISF